MALVIWAVLGQGVDWKTAGAWLVTVLLIEWPVREISRPMARGLSLSRAEAYVCMAIHLLATLAWTAAGAILWAQNNAACQLAGVAFFAGHLLYLQSHHGRSIGSLMPALPALAAPAIAPWVAPHYHGVNQLLVVVTMLAMVGLAVASVALNITETRRLKPAKEALRPTEPTKDPAEARDAASAA